jgi:hypothetical protein
MAYAGCSGFRAGVCTPFQFYDLEKEEVLPVTVHSAAIMDGTLNEYMNLNPEQALAEIYKLVPVVKMCNGEFISIWHNHTLNNKGIWKGWRTVFENMIRIAND